jgi:hypothetical protein
MTIIIKYPRQTKEGNKVFFEKKDKELTNEDWAKWGGWIATDGTLTYTYAKKSHRWIKRVDLKLKDRQPVELFSKTFETSLTDYLNKTITPEGVKREITMHQAVLREEKAEWFTKNVYPYLIKQEKKDYAAKLLGYRPESKGFEDWTPEEVRNYIATATDGDGSIRCGISLNQKKGSGKKNKHLTLRIASSDAQYLSDLKYITENKLAITTTLSEVGRYKTQKGIKTKYELFISCSRRRPNNLGFFQSLVKDGVMTLDRKKQKVQEFVGQA